MSYDLRHLESIITGMLKKRVFLAGSEFFYKHFVKKIFFKFSADRVHTDTVKLGQLLGRSDSFTGAVSSLLRSDEKALKQKIAGIAFNNPIGLSAGFDYEGRLTQILPAIDFGFETVGTITNQAYEGNPRPMLGRLPNSKSLMVNKGFKNLGAEETANRLEDLDFQIPVGISIGRSNNKTCDTQASSIKDITKAFKAFEQSGVEHSYYELNISCPNLFGEVTFYPPKNLEDLLAEIDKLHVTKPIFVKMPIEKGDKEVLKMLEVISKHSPRGVIFGNLQKDRKCKVFDKGELKKFPKGNFSGKPTYERSNELIKLAFKKYRDRFVIIGCGGVFSAVDAYEKILLGSTLVQLITGLVYNGPQLVSQINTGLADLLRRDGYKNISQAVGQRA